MVSSLVVCDSKNTGRTMHRDGIRAVRLFRPAPLATAILPVHLRCVSRFTNSENWHYSRHTWVRHFFDGIFRVGNSHCTLCTFSKFGHLCVLRAAVCRTYSPSAIHDTSHIVPRCSRITVRVRGFDLVGAFMHFSMRIYIWVVHFAERDLLLLFLDV